MIKDPWKIIRNEICFGNVEPSVVLVANSFVTSSKYGNDDPWNYPEYLPALSAMISYGSQINSIEKAKALNRNLVKRGHLTPLESLQFNFRVLGISKICGAQISRHRVGQGHVSGSRRFREQSPEFVYPLLSYIETEEEVRSIYSVMSAGVKDCYERSLQLQQPIIGVKKSDARYIISASTATARNWWINARALRDFFKLRLAPDAEWEVRRVAFMLLEIVYKETPSLFEDIYAKYTTTS